MPETAGTLEEAFAQADEQLNSAGSDSVEETEKDEVEEILDGEESTDESPKEDTQEDDEQESFTDTDPEELPEELKSKYKSMQADYTRKTQELAKARKESEKRIGKLEDELKELKESRVKQEQPVKKTAREQLSDLVKSEIEAERISEFTESAQDFYNSFDPRLEMDSETYDRATDLYVGQEMDERLAKHMEEGNPINSFDYRSELKSVLEEWDIYLVGKQKEFLSKQQKKAQQEAKKVKKQNPKGTEKRGRPKKLNLDEAISRAFEEN